VYLPGWLSVVCGAFLLLILYTELLKTHCDDFSIKTKMVELTARVRAFGEQGLTTPGDLQEGAGGRRSTVLRLLDEGN